MKSMTGFGSAKYSSKELQLEVNLKTVNGRFSEFKINMPYEYNSLEAEMKRIIQKKIQRGSINLYVGRKLGPAAIGSGVLTNTARAKAWLKAYRELGKSLNLEAHPNLELMTKVPDIFRFHDSVEVTSSEKKFLFATLMKAISSCETERLREGKALQKELLKLANGLAEQIGLLTEYREEADSYMKEQFFNKIKKLGFEGDWENPRVAQEVVLLIEKADIAEELQRLSEHIKNILDLVEGRTSQGKKLDFYIQELLREINTVGSKSPISKMTGAVVESKSLIEKMREQVQNIE